MRWTRRTQLTYPRRFEGRGLRRGAAARYPGGGYSLIEVLFASFLLLVVAISIIPMFTRALQSNLAGGRASAMATFAASDMEVVNQKTIDHEDYELEGTDFVSVATEYWNMGTDSTDNEGNKYLGDEVWQDDDTTGMILWERTTEVRKYAVSDILPIVDTSGTTLTGYGENPRIFDLPLKPSEEGSKHLVEFRVQIKPYGNVFGAGKQITISHFRTY